MPFVQRSVQPVRLSRVKLHDDNGAPTVNDRELDAVTNFTLSNALRQMASVATLADEVFRDLRSQLLDVATRSANLKCRVKALGELVDRTDPKAVTVPESDLTAFSLRTEHFKSKQLDTKNLLSAENRPAWVKRLYEQAGVPNKVYEFKHQVHRTTSRRKRSLDDSCLPNDIELRKPAALTNLRPWTSEEVLGDITVAPDCSSRIPRDPSPSFTDQVDHQLPSPEEQQHVIALKFPPQVVEVDVSGKSFNRMSALRRSLQNVEYETSVRRRKSRRPRGKRRNTIAGTDQKELEAVIGSLSDSNKDSDDMVSSSMAVVVTEKKSNLDLLKDWGRTRLKHFKNMETSGMTAVKLREKGKLGLTRRKWDNKDEPVHSSSGNWSASSESGQSTSTSHVPRSSVSSGSGSTKPTYHGGSSITSDEGETGSTYSCDTEGYYTSFHLDSGLKTLREEELPQPMSALHTTSALSPSFQSSLAESEYDIFGRGSTSTTASSAGTVCTSLMISPPNVPERGDSKLSDKTDLYGGSLPDRNLHASCQLKDLMYDKSKTAPSRLTKENITRYKEERLMIDVKPRPNLETCGDSPDSGHNTCSSPVDSITNPSVDLEMSECSDLEGIDRVERLRVKTTINTSRIPSMCVITPPMSDDEVSLKTLRQTETEDYGEYVTLAHIMPEVATVVEATTNIRDFVHLNELPAGSIDRKKSQGARVTLNSEGKVIYSSDSLKRRKKIHTTNTFEPGPCVNANVEMRPTNINNIISQAIPRTPLNVRPVSKQILPIQKTATISKSNSGFAQNPHTNKPINPGPIAQLKPLVPIPLACSPSVRRSRAAVPLMPVTGNPTVIRHSPRVVLPDSFKNTNCGKPVSPLISPTRRSLSPKEVVKGAYVRMQDPTDCLETSLDDTMKSVIKRSDSYRLANTNSPRLTKSPNMLIALQKARSENVQGNCNKTPTKNNNSCGAADSSNVSASTPVKANGTPSLIDMSSNNLSPIQRSPTTAYNKPSPVGLQPSNNVSKRSPPPAVTVRPASGRSAMDLYAAIHESKKRLLGAQQAPVSQPIQGTPVPKIEIKRPERQSDRVHRKENNPTAARYDFKRLLLQANMSSGRRTGGQSAVTRLQQPLPPPPPPPPSKPTVIQSNRLAAPLQSRMLQVTSRVGKVPSWSKSNVLSSTIQEDCREEEDDYGSALPKSSALVKRTLKDFTDNNTYSMKISSQPVIPGTGTTLETAL
ncbi:uncharacterized protein LOC126901608 [Daktulosphaira vitifoliae]|uniref:uncharacterized protein LOC126901608 n=1 Tax=Daktulosphaira vitifoliae TaxID=58002 RepID=UPI0021A9E0AD|nr:uncharacterized protein LOC126901608 [Daktulosphaira vitifoliae]